MKLVNPEKQRTQTKRESKTGTGIGFQELLCRQKPEPNNCFPETNNHCLTTGANLRIYERRCPRHTHQRKN